MTETSNLYQLTAPVTDDELDGALLDMTGDLDKARVLHQTLPHWMVNAPAHCLAALEQAHGDSENPRHRLKQRLRQLQPLDRFCTGKLREYLARKGHPELDVRRDFLERPRRDPVSVAPYVTDILIETAALEKHSLVHAAMQGFSAAEAQPGGLPEKSVIRHGEHERVAPDITAQQFVGYCRELDLGSAYQAHVRDVFSLPAPGETPMGLSYNQAALDIGLGKKADMLIDLHIALAKKHISQATHARLLKLIHANLPANRIVESAPQEKSLIWQGLNIDEACLWSVLVFSRDTPGELEAENLVVYMPNEPKRPWFEYPNLEGFKQYLTLKLQVATYREFFKGYLDESERLDFFKHFDEHHALGPLVAVPVPSNFSDFFFRACVGKVQLDAQVLAVPKAQMDEDARQQRWLDYLNDGLDILNVAGFIVPGLGQLMMGVAIGQLLGEVFDGVEDWSHGDNAEALKHLVAVAENVAGMVLFAAGGRVVGSLKRSLTSPAAFFDKVEAVSLRDHRPRLWRPRLGSYRQAAELDEPWVYNARGIHQSNGMSHIQIDRNLYSIGYDPGIGQWRLNHPERHEAYRPPLQHNFQGGWQHIFERPQEWNDPLYNLRRVDPALADVPSDALQSLAALNHTDLAELQRMASESEPLSERFQDALARFRQHRKILDLADGLGQGAALQPQTARTQMLALPLMPGWPEGRFFEVLDREGNLLESHPDLTPFDYEDQSIHITEQQLRDGEVMETLLAALTDEERGPLLGEIAAPDNAQAVLKRRLLATVNDQHRALYRRLYEDYNGAARGELVLLCTRFPTLPRRVAWELLSSASSLDRRYLRRTGRVPLALAQRSREMLDAMAEDQALMGLYWPPLAGAATRRVTVGLLGHLSNWPQDFLLQVRENSVTGTLLEQVGPPTASTRRTIVRSAQGFQAFNAQGADLNTRVSGPDALLQSVVDCLSPAQQRAMNLTGEKPVDRLRSQLRFKSQDERDRVARYLWPERKVALDEPSSCLRAQVVALAKPTEFPPALVRKVEKLYPSLTKTQVSSLLQDAGVDHLSRAKAVEALKQQFKSLQQALKRWSSDRKAHPAGASPLWDWRLSRTQARQAIERCWRGLFTLHNDEHVEVPGLQLDGMVLGGLPVLPQQVRFDHVQQLSLRNMQLSEDVSTFLEHFKGVRCIELADNHLSSLPEALSQMPALEQLNLARNRLQLTEVARKQLAGLRTLKSLNLAGNPLLDPPDVTQQLALRELILRDCRLSDFPDGVQRLPHLEYLDLRSNEIRELPDWVLMLPRRAAQALNLRNNPLSASSQIDLRVYRRRSGVGMGFLENDVSRLSEQKAREIWLTDEGVAGYAEKDLAWRGLKNEPGSDGLFNLLAELESTSDASIVREDLHRRVWRVLNAAASDAKLRERVFQWSATPINCDDAAAVNFSNLEVLVEINEATRGVKERRLTAKPLLRLAKRLFRLDQVEAFARRHSAEHPEADPLQVSLAFRTRLAQSLDLPGQPKHLKLEALAEVTTGDLTRAEKAVKTAELSPELLKYIGKLRFWIEYLKRNHASEFEALNAPFYRRLEALCELDPPLLEGDFIKQSNAIRDEQALAQTPEIDRLTEAQIRLDELPMC
ncbi:hypothetical protein BFW87_01765 [Pseudomonas fluorescens]|uniref:RING-type E3 ubiquitin transferase n=1 Tax=Pseudomonas fluorescens TaxID=294 RepID=A0A1T2Z8N0_PSEFL|nr:NEL-type E3 ubiquitin ligase domain-containing protein [Pseudomonas fluorescens]OPB00360.1 hypothetical protein BFW87_01765 [Pseudomonas fluorescens]